MKRLIITGFALLLAFSAVSAQKKQPYKPGEKVRYQIKYGIISGGIANLELKEEVWQNKKVWHGVLSGQTTGIADAMYKVRDTYETFINPVTDLPVFSIRNISEGHYRKYNEVIFDHHSRADSAILMSDLSGRHITQQGILDVLSCFYWFRKYNLANIDTLKPGDIFTMTTWFADELYPIILRYKGIEYIKIKGGKVRCYCFNPVTEVGRLFKTSDDMSVWFTTDENFLPVKVRFDIFVGSVYVDMIHYEGLTKPLVYN
jgi:hypothetical protein